MSNQTLNLSSLVEKISDLAEIRFTDRDLELLSRDNPETLSGEDILPGLIVDLAEIMN